MAVNKETLKAYISEQQRYHDELTKAFQEKNTKIVTYIGAILALLAFLYAGALGPEQSTRVRLFIPKELYGQLFYVFGLFMILYALGKLVHGARPNGYWTVAVESKDVSLVETEQEIPYLLKLKDDYEEARKSNIAESDRKHFALRDSFYPMLLGAIIMIVLRYFQ